MTASVLCKDVFDISYENSHTHTRRLYVAAAYLFLKCNFILVCGMFFLIDGTFILTTFESYRIYFLFFTTYVSHYGKFIALHQLISIVLQLTNQIK